MIEGFDTRTLTVVLLLLALIEGMSLCAYARTHPSFRGFWQISSGLLLMALGWGLIGLREFISVWYSIIISGALVIYSITLMGTGILQFFNFPYQSFRNTCLALLTLQLISFVFFTIYTFEPKWRIVTLCLIFVFQCFYLASKLSQIKSNVNLFSIRLLFFLFVVYGLAFFARGFWTLFFYEAATQQAITIAHISSLLTFIIMVVASSAIIVWNASHHLQSNLKIQATIDPLTQVYNRRALESLAESEIGRSQRQALSLAVVLIDIDHFKVVNDSHGHQFGDNVLAQFCTLITNKLRAYDIFARFGGEEFILILPNTCAEDAVALAEKIRVLVAETSFRQVGTDNQCKLTASFGVTSNNYRHVPWKVLVSNADKALYRAKNKGRNSVELEQYSAETQTVS